MNTVFNFEVDNIIINTKYAIFLPNKALNLNIQNQEENETNLLTGHFHKKNLA